MGAFIQPDTKCRRRSPRHVLLAAGHSVAQCLKTSSTSQRCLHMRCVAMGQRLPGRPAAPEIIRTPMTPTTRRPCTTDDTSNSAGRQRTDMTCTRGESRWRGLRAKQREQKPGPPIPLLSALADTAGGCGHLRTGWPLRQLAWVFCQRRRLSCPPAGSMLASLGRPGVAGTWDKAGG